MIKRVPDKAIRVGLKDALNGLTYSGSPVKIFAEVAPPGDGYPRIRITGISSLDTGSKSQNMYSTDVTLTVEDRRVNVANENVMDDLADIIAGILVPSIQDELFSVTGFRVLYINYSSTPVSTFEIKPHIYINKNIRLTIQTEQLP